MLGHYDIIYDSTFIWPDSKGGYDYYRKFISEVTLADKGRSVLSRPATPVLDKDDKIDIFAYTRLVSGETLVADASDMITRDLPGNKRWIFINFRQAEPGATLHLEWTLSSKEGSIAGKRFLGRTVPVDTAVIVISVPQNWVFNFAISPPIKVDRVESISPLRDNISVIAYSWRAKKLPGLSREEFAPPLDRMIACLYYSFYYDAGAVNPEAHKVDWNYLSQLYFTNLRDFARSSAALNAVQDSLEAITRHKTELAQMAFDWMGVHFRPVYSDIALSGNANEALERGRGTQGEAAALLYILLEKLKVPATPYLVATHDAGDPLPDLPALIWFDRLLLKVALDSDTLWIDPLYQIPQMGILPFEDQGARALKVDETGGYFATIPMPDYRDNGKAIHLKLNLDSSGSLHGEATEIYSGAMIPEITTYLKNLEEKEGREPWEKKLAKSFPGVKISRFVIIPSDTSGQPYKIGYSFVTGPMVRPFANSIYIPMDLLGRWADLPAMSNRSRQFPIELRRPRFELERVTLTVSPPFQIEYLPDNYSEDTDLGQIYSVARGDSSMVTITRGFGLKKAELPLAEYGSLRKFLNRARAEADKHIILKKTG